MSKSPFVSFTTITVGIAFDEHSAPLLRLGAEMAKRLRKSLCLVHVVEPWIDLSAEVGPFVTPYPLWESLKAVESENREIAEKRLADLVATTIPGVEPRLVVTGGATVDALAREAATARSFLLLIGASPKSGGLLSGVSSGLSLLSSSAVPVMAIDTAKAKSFGEAPPRLLVADDLTENSLGALAFAATVAEGFAGASVRHVHASSLTEAQMRVAVEAAAAAARAPLGATEAGDIFRAFNNAQAQRLGERFAPYRETVESRGGMYEATVISGGSKPDLKETVAAYRPDLLVFGRHKAIHTKPFSLGRLPHRSMLAYGLPVVVVPQDLKA